MLFVKSFVFLCETKSSNSVTLLKLLPSNVQNRKSIQHSKFNIMIELTPIFVLAIIFGFIYAVIYLNVRRKERMALLEKGADPSIFQEPKSDKVTSLRYGLFLIGLAIGILMGNVLEVSTELGPEASYFSMVFLFGGIALVISHFLGKKVQS